MDVKVVKISKAGSDIEEVSEAIEACNADPSNNWKLTSWKNEPKFNDLYSDYSSAQDDHGIFLNELEKRKINFDGGATLNIPKGKSSVRPKLIRKQAEWKYPALEEPFLNTEDMFEVRPRTYEDAEAALQNQTLLNYQWEVKIDKVSLVGDAVRTIYNEGTVIVKTGWESQEETIQVEKEFPIYASPEESLMLLKRGVNEGKIAPEQAEAMMLSGKPMQVGTEMKMVDKNKLVKNQPVYEVCDNRNVIIDPTCNGIIEDAQFIIHEYETDMSTLKKAEFVTHEETDPETGEVTKHTSGIYKNLNKITISSSTDTREYYNDTTMDETTFEFKDDPRKKLRAYEYWGFWDTSGNGEVVPIIATWVGKTMIRMEINPFPFQGLPFSLAKYMPKKNDIHGEADGDLLIENQQSIGRMTRAAEDITSDQAIGQTFIDERFFASPSQRDNYSSGKTTYFTSGMNPKTSVHKETVDSVPRTVFDMISLQNADAESLTGTKAFSQGISSQALGSVATGIRSALDATAKRELSILRRLSDQLFKDMASKTIIMNQTFLDEEEVVRITNKEYVTIRREDLKGEFDLKINVSTPERDNETAEHLNMLMQTNAASMNPKMANKVYGKIARLWKLPDLANDFETFEPEPNPVQEELQKLQLENANLENKKLMMEIANLAKAIESEDSKIVERGSRTAQNLHSESIKDEASAKESLADAREADAKARKLDAETRAIESSADLQDQEFLRVQDGTKRKEQETDKEYDALVKQESQEAKALQDALDHKRNEEAMFDQKLDDQMINAQINQGNQNGNI